MSCDDAPKTQWWFPVDPHTMTAAKKTANVSRPAPCWQAAAQLTHIVISHYFHKAAVSPKCWRAECVWLPWTTAVWIWTLPRMPLFYSINKHAPETSIKLKKSTFPPLFWRIPAIPPAQRSSCPLLLPLKLSSQSECEASSQVLGERILLLLFIIRLSALRLLIGQIWSSLN